MEAARAESPWKHHYLLGVRGEGLGSFMQTSGSKAALGFAGMLKHYCGLDRARERAHCATLGTEIVSPLSGLALEG